MAQLVLHFLKPPAWADKVHLHYWDRLPAGDDSPWPGLQMQPEGDGWYVCRLNGTRSARLVFSDEEVKTLRKYLLNGGFLMVDDFWGNEQWYNFYREIKRVFPNREPVEIPLDHQIFHAVFDLRHQSLPVPAAGQPCVICGVTVACKVTGSRARGLFSG